MKKFIFVSVCLVLICFTVTFGIKASRAPTTTARDNVTTAFPSTPLPSDVTLPTNGAEFIRVHREVENSDFAPTFGIFKDFAEFEIFRDIYLAEYYRETPFQREYNLQLFYQNCLAFIFLRLPSSSIPRLDSLVWSPKTDFLFYNVTTYTPPDGATDEQEWLLLVPVDENTVSPSNLGVSIQILSAESPSEIGYVAPAATPVAYDTTKSSAHRFIPTPNHVMGGTSAFLCRDIERFSEYRRTFLRAMDEAETVDLSVYDEAFFSEYALIIAYIDTVGSDETELAIRRVDAVDNYISLVLSRHASVFPDYPYTEEGVPGCVFVAVPLMALSENPHIEIQLLSFELK